MAILNRRASPRASSVQEGLSWCEEPVCKRGRTQGTLECHDLLRLLGSWVTEDPSLCWATFPLPQAPSARGATCCNVTSLIPLELTACWGILRGARKGAVPACPALLPPLPREVQQCVKESQCFTYVQAASSPLAQVQLWAGYENPMGSLFHRKERRGGARRKTTRVSTSPWEAWPWGAGSALTSGSQHPVGATTSSARANWSTCAQACWKKLKSPGSIKQAKEAFPFSLSMEYCFSHESSLVLLCGYHAVTRWQCCAVTRPALLLPCAQIVETPLLRADSCWGTIVVCTGQLKALLNLCADHSPSFDSSIGIAPV